MHFKSSDEKFARIVSTSNSIRQVLKKLNLKPVGGNYKTFSNRVSKLKIDTSHFTGKGHLKNKTHNWNKKIPLDEILVSHSTYNPNQLKNRLIKAKLLEYKCDICCISSWEGKYLSLHLDHINGVNTDHRLKNLRLLCPNCHSQTTTYCRRKSAVGIEGVEPSLG